MSEFINAKNERVAVLTVDDVLELHKLLCDNYKLLPEMEPISPSGVKDENMLHSAVSRQLVGSGDYYKYDNSYRNCATLIYGLVKNHCFYNGNKRMGFLALIKHLYMNGYVLKPSLSHEEIYELLRTLADNSIVEHSKKYYPKFYKGVGRKKDKWDDELEIEYMAHWVRNSIENKQSRVKKSKIATSELKAIVEAKGCEYEQDKNRITITWRPGLFDAIFGRKKKILKLTVPYGKYVMLDDIERIRKEFNLTLGDGVDHVAFYDSDNFLNEEIKSYKKIIYRLAKT